MKQNGIGFMGALTLIFVTLKLLAIQPVAAWSWWLVLLPLYGVAAVLLGLALICFLVAVIIDLGEKAAKYK